MQLFKTKLAILLASLAIRPALAQPLNVVLLGDSFAAGNGARDRYGSRAYEPGGCYRSLSGWAGIYSDLLRDELGYAVNFINAACSGSTLESQEDSLRDVNMQKNIVAVTPISSLSPLEAMILIFQMS